MRNLTEGELHALRNLAEKSAGNMTAFLRIADAQRLTELGLATRSQQGWDITAAGAAYLNESGTDADDRGAITQLKG